MYLTFYEMVSLLNHRYRKVRLLSTYPSIYRNVLPVGGEIVSFTCPLLSPMSPCDVQIFQGTVHKDQREVLKYLYGERRDEIVLLFLRMEVLGNYRENVLDPRRLQHPAAYHDGCRDVSGCIFAIGKDLGWLSMLIYAKDKEGFIEKGRSHDDSLVGSQVGMTCLKAKVMVKGILLECDKGREDFSVKEKECEKMLDVLYSRQASFAVWDGLGGEALPHSMSNASWYQLQTSHMKALFPKRPLPESRFVKSDHYVGAVWVAASGFPHFPGSASELQRLKTSQKKMLNHLRTS